MTPASQTTARRLRRTMMTLLAIIGTTLSLFFAHSLDEAPSADPSDSAASLAISTLQGVEVEADDPTDAANDADICRAPEARPGIAAPRAFFSQHSAVAVLTYAPRIRWSGLTGCPESPPRPVTLTALCVSQT